MKRAGMCLAVGMILLVGSFWLPEIWQNYLIRQEQVDLISGYLEEPEEKEPKESVSESDTEDPKGNSPMYRNLDFEGLQQINPEIVGWIYVPGTQIDYPICCGSDNDYYLTHSFRRSRNALGAIFVPAETSEDLTDAHTIVYGHNMRSGKMFGELSNYADQGFRDRYPYVYIYTPDHSYTCTVYAAYRTRYDSAVYTIGYETGTEVFREWIHDTVGNAAYDCGIAPTGQEQIFTLSTCVDSGSAKDRLVVQCVVTDHIDHIAVGEEEE
ncbi:MAG: class B sortase [Lacrimispora saccharolytica]